MRWIHESLITCFWFLQKARKTAALLKDMSALMALIMYIARERYAMERGGGVGRVAYMAQTSG